jgi:hypothetical protein
MKTIKKQVKIWVYTCGYGQAFVTDIDPKSLDDNNSHRLIISEQVVELDMPNISEEALYELFSESKKAIRRAQLEGQIEDAKKELETL